MKYDEEVYWAEIRSDIGARHYISYRLPFVTARIFFDTHNK